MIWSVMSVVAAGAEPELWGSAAISGGVNVFTESGVSSADPLATQVELDGAVGWGWGHVRVDADLHVDPTNADGFVVYPSDPPGLPEWAMVQVGREQLHLRAGVLNPNLGLEDWDPWVNYAPTYSANFVLIGPGRFLGAEPSITLDGGVDLFAFGGYDLDWRSYGGGVGVATAQDAWSTWSGVVVYPSFGTCGAGTYTPPSTLSGTTTGGEGASCFFTDAILSFEFYPLDPLWIAIDSNTGVRAGGFFSSEQLVVNVVPEAVVNPFVRAELLIDPDNVIGGAPATASVGARSDFSIFRVSLEAKSIFVRGGGTPDLGLALVLAAHGAEPSPYSYQDPFGAEEEE